MKKRSTKLEQDLVQAAEDFQRLSLWRHFDDNDVFLIHVPTEQLPLVASVLGSAGEEFGLGIMRGEEAFRHFTDLILDPSSTSARTKSGDLLTLSFDSWESLGEEYRRVLIAAGRQPRREKHVPFFFTRPPFELARPMNRSEMRSLLWALRGILAANAAGEFRPFQLDEEGQRILELRVSGRPKEPDVTCGIVAWPPISRAPATLAALPRDLAALSRKQERWLFGICPLPGAIEGDERAVYGALLAVENGPILDLRVLMGDELDPAIALIVDALRGHCPHSQDAGIPSAILFSDQRLFDTLVPALAALDIRVTLTPEHSSFRALFASLAENMGGPPDATEDQARSSHQLPPQHLQTVGFADLSSPSGTLGQRRFSTTNKVTSDPPPPQSTTGKRVESTGRKPGEQTGLAPGTLGHWRQASLRLTEKLLDQVISGDLITPRAMKRYFGSHEETDEVLAELQHLGPFPSLLEWFITDYRATKRSKTLIEKLLAKQALEPIERKLLEARAATLPSIYRIDASTPGESLQAEDVLTGERVTIHDISMSKCALEGTFVPLRLLALEQWRIPLLAGPPLSALQISTALGRLQTLGIELTPAGLKDTAHLLGRLWSLHLQAEAPTITNTDGDELELQTASFHLDNPAAIEAYFEGHPDFDFDDEQGTWTWSREGGPGGFGDRTTLAHFTRLDEHLLVEVNSAERLARARAWLEALPGIRLESTHRHDPDEVPLDDRLPGPAPAPLDADQVGMFEDAMLETYLRWVDSPIPAFGGITPRQACKSDKGAREVALMIRTIPSIPTPFGVIQPPREKLLQMLGLE